VRSGRTLAGAAAAGAALAAYCLFEARWPVLRQFEAPVLPPGAEPLRVLHISDAHFTGDQRWKIQWVRALDRLQPDLVVTTGDNFASSEGMEAALEAFEPLLARPGAFVLGSNDFHSARLKNPLRYLFPADDATDEPPPDLPTGAFTGVLTRAGWLDLDNRRGHLELGRARLQTDLVGLADPHVGWDRLPAPATHPPGRLVLGLVHAPYVAAVQALVDDAARLVLAGHTHGGQVAAPFLGALVTNSDLPRRLARGLHEWRPSGCGAYLHVSAGLGTSPYTPFRLAVRPEATLLTLTGA
jgi:predicted MPP superfamily phosphohydrolase